MPHHSTKKTESTEPHPGDGADWEGARDALKRAYLLVSWGELQNALDACNLAESLLAPDEAPLPGALRGSILTAAGRTDDALAELRHVTRRWKTDSLAHLYFAEACLVSGRERQARRALSKAKYHDDGTYAEFIEHLESLTDASLPVGEPLTIPMSDAPHTTGDDDE